MEKINLTAEEWEKIGGRGDRVIEIPGRLTPERNEQSAEPERSEQAVPEGFPENEQAPERISLTDREKLELAKKTILRLRDKKTALEQEVERLESEREDAEKLCAEIEQLEIENGQLKSENRQLEKNYAEINDLYDELHDQDEALRKAHEALKDRVLAVLLKREEEEIEGHLRRVRQEEIDKMAARIEKFTYILKRLKGLRADIETKYDEIERAPKEGSGAHSALYKAKEEIRWILFVIQKLIEAEEGKNQE